MKLLIIEPIHYASLCRIFKLNSETDKSYYYEKIVQDEIPDYDSGEKRCNKKSAMAIVDVKYLEEIEKFNKRKSQIHKEYLDASREISEEFKEFLKGIKNDN